MDTGYYSPSRRNFYTSTKDASSEEIRSSLKYVKREYSQALDEIADLKHEKANLKAVIDQSFQDRAEEDYRRQSTEIENASQRLKQSYTQRALIEAEQRIVDLEDENIKLRRLVDSNSTRMKKLQEQLISAHDQVDKLDHLKIFNKHLQNEMQYLDQEFQSIIKRVEDLDEEKTKAKIKKSVSVKYSQDYNQTLLKYVNYIMSTISGLDSSNSIRTRFEELFPISSNILKLVANRDYANLMLKSFKFIADLLPKDTDQEQFSPSFSQATGSPQLSHNASNAQIFQNNLEISRLSSQLTNNSKSNAFQSPNSKKDMSKMTITPTSKNRPPSPGIVPVSSEKAKVISRQDSISSTANKKLKESQLSVNTSLKDYKPRLLRSVTPNGLRPTGSSASLRSNQSGAQRNEVLIHDRMVAGPAADRRETSSTNRRNPSFSAKVEELQDQQVELELIQRERELIEKERELMERKRELIYKARELQEKEQELEHHDEEQHLQPENEVSMEHNRSHSYKRSQQNSYADIRRIRQEEKERTKSPALLRPILKSSSSQVLAVDQDASKKNFSGTPGNRIGGNVRDFSNILREKSKHLAKALSSVSAYDDEIQTLNVKSEQEATYPRDTKVSKSRERTPINSNHLDYDGGLEQLRASKVKSSSKKPVYDDYVDSPYNPGESDGSEQRGYQVGSGASTYKSNSNIASYHPTPVESKRKDEREYRREDSNKRVYFDNQDDESVDDEYTNYQQQKSASNLRQQNEYENPTRSGRIAEIPKGVQYASFSVSFGRTESAERSHSPPPKDAGSILDVPLKKRVDHVVQTYDVVKGEDVSKVAVRDNCSPQYKVSVDSKNKLKRTQTPTPKSSTSTNKASSQKNGL